MAYLNILVVLSIVAFALPSTLAMNYIVGDSQGWGFNVNYTEWALGKKFYAGDELTFNYEQGSHNVVKVNGTAFQLCTVPNGDTTPFTSGADVIPLKEGERWYICGFPNHCTKGMKLVINVLPVSAAPEPPPSSGDLAPPPSAATGLAFSRFQAWIVGVFSILMMIMV